MIQLPVVLTALLLFGALHDSGKGRNAVVKGRDSTQTIIDTARESETVGVESITIARDDSGSAAIVIEAPTPSDRQFHAIVLLEGAGGGRSVKVDLVAVDAGGEQNLLVVSSEYLLEDIDNQVDVTFSLPRDWPVGVYRIDAYVNRQLSKSKEFTVQ